MLWSVPRGLPRCSQQMEKGCSVAVLGSIKSGGLAWGSAAALALLVGGCDGANDEPAGNNGAATSDETASATPESQSENDGGGAFAEGDLVEPRVDRVVTVTYGEYPLPDTTGYSTSVVFEATNPAQALVPDVRYRVELLDSEEQLMDRSDGSDAFTLQPGETRLVVHTQDPAGDRPPADADVSVYAAPGFAPNQDEFDPVPPDEWEAEETAVTCDGFTVGCDATGDLTWTGDREIEVEIASIDVVVRDGGPDGELVAAGSGTGEIDALLRPGQTLPFRVTVQGLREGGEHLHVDTHVEALPLFTGH